MSIDSRLGWWIFGCLVGFIIGYIIRSLREIKEKVDEVDEHITQHEHDRDGGFFERSLLNRIALLLVVALTVWAAFSSQISSNKVKDNQRAQDVSTQCTQTFLSETIKALNARTQYTLAQSNANYNLQKAQAQFIGLLVLSKTPLSHTAAAASLQTYFNALTKYLTVTAQSNATVVNNPYPSNHEYTNCLKGKKGP